MAHTTKTELEEDEFQDKLQKFTEAVNIGFESNQDAQQKWLAVLKKIETDKITDLEDLDQRFEELAEVIKRREAQTLAVCCCCCWLVTLTSNAFDWTPAAPMDSYYLGKSLAVLMIDGMFPLSYAQNSCTWLILVICSYLSIDTN